MPDLAPEPLLALRDYLDARLAYEFASREAGSNGHDGACLQEQQALDETWNHLAMLIDVLTPGIMKVQAPATGTGFLELKHPRCIVWYPDTVCPCGKTRIVWQS